MLSEAEKVQLAIYRGMATMNGAQALEYHELLVKESKPERKVVVTEANVVVEAPKKRGRKAKV